MEVCRKSSWLFLLLGLLCLAATLQGVQGGAESEGPSESECRPYIEKALKELEIAEAIDPKAPGDVEADSKEDVPTVEITTDDSDHEESDGDNDDDVAGTESAENVDPEQEDAGESKEKEEEVDDHSFEQADEAVSSEDEKGQSEEAHDKTDEEDEEEENKINSQVDEEVTDKESREDEEQQADDTESIEDGIETTEEDQEVTETSHASAEDEEIEEAKESDSIEDKKSIEDEGEESVEATNADGDSTEDAGESEGVDTTTGEGSKEEVADIAEDVADTKEDDADGKEGDGSSKEDDAISDDASKEAIAESAEDKESVEESSDNTRTFTDEVQEEVIKEDEQTVESVEEADAKESVEDVTSKEVDEKIESVEDVVTVTEEAVAPKEDDDKVESTEDEESAPEEELINEDEVPEDLRPTDHITQLLKLDEENVESQKIINKVADITLKELKKLYENAIKPLEVLYKYRDLSNRHFGDAEIFSKPLVVFMGPWSGGKSSIINYLVDNEYNETSLRTGAEPSPAYFNILMYGEEPEVLDGTQLAADYTFSGLQKFGQGLEERLRGLKLPQKLLEKINIVEIPGILEVRKQVSRVFPFNDACQWFIDRADIIFLVYDPSKLDVGPETEAILDQLKGREHQTRIILNKADQVKPEELMRVQGALIWNISPLMSSAQPPIMYTTSLWSRPYEPWAPVRLLQAQERAFLRDLRSAVDKRIENKISSARRFAVRVRNHAKMVDCYLTTYYNHKSVFGNRKQVADAIIEHPQDYHIYEGLSTLTNISRYDLPDPDVYRDFFRLNPLYDFQQLSATCTYFRGCPINRLDVAIAYDLPELVGKYKRMVDGALVEASQAQAPGS